MGARVIDPERDRPAVIEGLPVLDRLEPAGSLIGAAGGMQIDAELRQIDKLEPIALGQPPGVRHLDRQLCRVGLKPRGIQVRFRAASDGCG